jgi:glycerophosphoryl diester phosphodiesterase
VPASSRTLILGHRGAPRSAPENTLRAFRAALEAGADGIELDVQPSADGVPVVLHDDTLERTTDGRGDVALLPWRVIERARSHGEPVPRLEQVAEWAAASGAVLNVELKRPGAEQVSLECIRAAGLQQRTFYSSFLPGVVATVRRLDASASCWLLSDDRPRVMLAQAEALRPDGVCLDTRRVTPALLQRLGERGLPVVVWTVDRPARIRALLAAGVHGVITNQPALAVRLRQEASRSG